MTEAQTIILNLLAEHGTLNNVQLAEHLGDYGIADALRELEAEGAIEWSHALQGWLLVEDGYFDDSMDGDAGSALASAGWGTDEDYGYAGDVL